MSAFLIAVLAQPGFVLPPSAAEVGQLVTHLGSDSFEVRESATKELKSLGERAVPALEAAKASPDAEVRRRAARLLADVAARREERQRQPLQGRWRVTAWEEGGKRFAPADLNGELVIAGNGLRWDFRLEGQPVTVPGAFTVGGDGGRDTIDFLGADPRNSELGIYRLEGDTLTVCLARQRRPSQFASAAARLVTLERQTP